MVFLYCSDAVMNNVNETEESPRRQRGLVSLARGQQVSALIRLVLEDART